MVEDVDEASGFFGGEEAFSCVIDGEELDATGGILFATGDFPLAGTVVDESEQGDTSI